LLAWSRSSSIAPAPECHLCPASERLGARDPAFRFARPEGHQRRLPPQERGNPTLHTSAVATSARGARHPPREFAHLTFLMCSVDSNLAPLRQLSTLHSTFSARFLITARRQDETEGRSQPGPEQMTQDSELLAHADIIGLQCHDTGDRKANKEI